MERYMPNELYMKRLFNKLNEIEEDQTNGFKADLDLDCYVNNTIKKVNSMEQGIDEQTEYAIIRGYSKQELLVEYTISFYPKFLSSNEYYGNQTNRESRLRTALALARSRNKSKNKNIYLEALKHISNIISKLPKFN
ncbi:hypothetical protein J2127_001060 [Methanococcus voltae]|uniref:hypothetical protein n=1 Tax=Methanococcus voltae TaxID=2188 RepID=UPI001AE9FA48|nr:hypothetical protein [Methanococcus voltae]MBP2143891.1 hypothetical protein [Methanococcus voltae]